MEKLFKPYDREFMRMAMLRHEETFKEQVYELHRLYQIQKILMKNIGRSRKNETHFSNQLESHINKRQLWKLDLEQPLVATEDQFNKINISNDNKNGVMEIIDESEIELTLGLGLGPTSYSRGRKTEPGPLTSDSGPSFSSSSTGSSQMNPSRYESRETTRTELNDSDGGCLKRLPADATSSGYQYSRKNNIDDDINDDIVDEELRRERLKHHPPWLFQVLSLNMT
ncbi:hypothetical protein PanWU01x14_107650 [Parasponia andersonii]|uniref:Uncharacterized protein n=1 Tax=Parasponia andersonii TaxID=3476 RepID=A0A2P5D097_PARAD|nr:hypothetical protein PanWU01x14_107650 [Parasponia andersonii]